MRKADGGPGFVNTFSPEKIAEWKNYGKTKLTDQANHHFNILCDEIQKINALKSMTTSSTNNSDNDGGEADHDDEDDNDVAKKVTKSVGRSVKGSMVQKAKAIRAKKVDKPKVDTSLNSLMGNKVGKKQPMKQPKRAPRTTGLKTIAAGKRPTSAKNVARKHLHGKSKQDDELDSSDDSNGSNGSNESEERDSDMPVQNAFVKEGKTLINVKTGARKSFAVSSKGAKEASKDEQEPLQKVVRKVVINMPKGPKTHSGHAGPAEVEKSVANATNVTNATNLTLPFIDFGHTKESFEELPESDKSRLLVIMNHIQNLKRERDGADVAVKGNNGGNNGGAKKRVKVDDEQQA